MGKILDIYIDDVLAKLHLCGESGAKAETAIREALEKAADGARQRGYSEERAEIEAAIRMNRPLIFSRTLWTFPEYRFYLFELFCRLIFFAAFIYILGKYFPPFWCFFAIPVAFVAGDILRAKKFRALFRDGLCIRRRFKQSFVIPFEKIAKIELNKKDLLNLPPFSAMGGQLKIQYDGGEVIAHPAFLNFRPAVFALLAFLPDVFAPEIKARMDRIANGLFNIKPRFELAMPVHFRGMLLAMGLICLTVVGYCAPQLWVCDLTDMTLYAFAVLMLTVLIGAFGFADRLRAGLCWLIAAALPFLVWHGYRNMVAGAREFYRIPLSGSGWDLLPDETTDTLILGRWADNNFRAAPAQVFHLTPPERQLREDKNPPSKYLVSSIRPRESKPAIPQRSGKRAFAWKSSPDGKKIFVLSELGQGRATNRIYLVKSSIWDIGRKRWTEIEAFNLAQSVIMLGLNAIQPYNISWSPDSRNVCYGSVRFLMRSPKRIDSGFNLRVARYENWAERHLKK